MNLYCDTSFLVPLFAIEAFSLRAGNFLIDQQPSVVMSDFAAAEFSSAIAQLYRAGSLTAIETRMAFNNFDAWSRRETLLVDTTTSDIAVANDLVRRSELCLRAPDAIHIAIVQRLDLTLATFDDQMIAAARKLRMKVAKI